jgi:hypothetical protein
MKASRKSDTVAEFGFSANKMHGEKRDFRLQIADFRFRRMRAAPRGESIVNLKPQIPGNGPVAQLVRACA